MQQHSIPVILFISEKGLLFSKEYHFRNTHLTIFKRLSKYSS